MTTKNEIKNQLLAVHPTTPLDKLLLSDFSSFMAYRQVRDLTRPNHPFLTNQLLRQDFPNRISSTDKNRVGPIELVDHYQLDFDFDPNFFNDEPFNNNAMFVALNVAARDNQSNAATAWQNFHDQTRVANTVYMYLETHEDQRFAGSYITDIIKNVTDSNSQNIGTDFFLTGKKHFANATDTELANILYQKFCTQMKAILAKTASTEVTSATIQQKANQIFTKITNSNHQEAIPKDQNLAVARTLVAKAADLTSWKALKNKTIEKVNHNISVARELIQKAQIIDQQHDLLAEACSRVKSNRQLFSTCIDLLVTEIQIIHPRQLIIFGGYADKAVQRVITILAAEPNQTPAVQYAVDVLSNHRKLINHYSSLLSVPNSLKAAAELIN